MITKVEYEEWLTSQVTKTFFEALEMEREVMKENLIRELYESPPDVIGRAAAIQNILDMEYDDVVAHLIKERKGN